MAQELHDGVGHGLAVIAMQAGVGLHVLDRDPAAARTALEAIRDSARESLDALRAELAQVSGAQISGEPAPRRPRQGVADLDALVDRVRTAGLSVALTGSPGELDGAGRRGRLRRGAGGADQRAQARRGDVGRGARWTAHPAG